VVVESEVRVAKIDLFDEGDFKIEERWRHGWDARMREPITDPATGDLLRIEEHTKRFLQVLDKVYTGSILFATDLHDEAHCPFAGGDSLPFRRHQRQATNR
jgi:hypothetical protein